MPAAIPADASAAVLEPSEPCVKPIDPISTIASTLAAIPADASAAVLKPSEPMPEFAVSVEGPNFDAPFTLESLLGSYQRIGFQATSLGKAIEIVNHMVSIICVCVFSVLVYSYSSFPACLATLRRTGTRGRIRRIPGSGSPIADTVQHFSRIYLEPDLIRAARNYTAPRQT